MTRALQPGTGSISTDISRNRETIIHFNHSLGLSLRRPKPLKHLIFMIMPAISHCCYAFGVVYKTDFFIVNLHKYWFDCVFIIKLVSRSLLACFVFFCRCAYNVLWCYPFKDGWSQKKWNKSNEFYIVDENLFAQSKIKRLMEYNSNSLALHFMESDGDGSKKMELNDGTLNVWSAWSISEHDRLVFGRSFRFAVLNH